MITTTEIKLRWSHLLSICFSIVLLGYFPQRMVAHSTTSSCRIIYELSDLPFKEVTDLLYDSDGLLWIATRNGLYCYDNYRLQEFRKDHIHMDRLAGNEIKRVTEDHQKRIWIITGKGLDRLDKQTLRMERLQPDHFPAADIQQVIVSKNGHLWFATGKGLYEYSPETDTYQPIPITGPDGQPMEVYGECLLEDHRGYIWFGTWDKGLFRYHPQSKEMVSYPQMNSRNSAHVLLEDEQKRIWVAGWTSGIHILSNAWDLEQMSIQTFAHPDLISNTSYCMSLDYTHRYVLIGSTRGITVADTEELGHFQKLMDEQNESALPGEEVTGIVAGPNGFAWVGMIGKGVAAIEPSEMHFAQHTLPTTQRNLKTSSIRSIFADRQGNLWLGIGTQGLAVWEKQSGNTYFWNEIPALQSLFTRMSTIYAIAQSFDGHIWVSCYGGELLELAVPEGTADIRNLSVKYWKNETSPLKLGLTFSIFEDRSDHLWFGGRNGIYVKHPDGLIEGFDSLRVDEQLYMTDLDIRQITQDLEGNLWLASNNHGIFQLSKQQGVWQATHFFTNHSDPQQDEIQTICCDSRGNLWAGSNLGDLYVLQPGDSLFQSVKTRWQLPGSSITFIWEEQPQVADPTQTDIHLWVGTNMGLMQLEPSSDLQTARVQLYTKQDGLLDDKLIRNAITQAPDGTFYVGTHKGYNSFRGEKLRSLQPRLNKVAISDLLVNDVAWASLPEKERLEVSEQSPQYTHDIYLTHKQTSLVLEFCHIGLYVNANPLYTYRLERYDDNWRRTNNTQGPRAFYSNLPPGDYLFQLMPYSNYNTNVASQMAQTLRIHILPAWWQTWWAQLGYVALAFILFIYLYRMGRRLQFRYKQLLIRARERAALRKGDIIIKPNKPAVTSADNEFITRAVECINQHMSDPDFDQAQFLEEMGVSKATCFRKLKALSGMNFTDFNRDIRLKAAQKILQEQPNIRISDLAYAVGFSDPKYFSNCFKKAFGSLPSEVSKNTPDKAEQA